MDSIGDFLTTIRNASSAGNDTCRVQWTKIRVAILQILKNKGYIGGFDLRKDTNEIVIFLKYLKDNSPVIKGVQRVSKPGKRLYYPYSDIPKVLGGLGISILTTSQGLMTDKEARINKAGGELLCKVW